MKNKFFSVHDNEDQLSVSAALQLKGFSELQNTMISDNESEQLSVVINKEAKQFWVTDETGLKETQKLIKERFNQEITETTFNEVAKWK